MNRFGSGKRWLACVALGFGGCGAIPDFLVDAGREAAKDALEEAVEEVLSGVADDLWNSIDGFRPRESDDGAGRDAGRER